MLYRACAAVGLANPRAVDELELWEIAAVIGANDSEDTSSASSASGVRNAEDERRAWNARRAEALERGEPPPTFDGAPSRAQQAAFEQLLRTGAG